MRVKDTGEDKDATGNGKGTQIYKSNFTLNFLRILL